MLPLVITHAGCNDGRWAAHVAQLYHGKDNVEIYYANYGDPPPSVEGRHVVITDFSYPRDILLKMKEAAASLHVLDHHASAQRNLEGLDFCTFDMNHSGAVLAWKFYFPHEEVPDILKHVEDYDLWRFNYPLTQAIIKGMYADWDEDKALEGLAASRGADLIPYYGDMGLVLLRKQETDLARLAKRAHRMLVCGYNIPAVNTTEYYSELGGLLARGEPFSLCYSLKEDGETVALSFRSQVKSEPQAVDVSKIAEAFNGGGHPGASGGRTDMLTILAMIRAAREVSG